MREPRAGMADGAVESGLKALVAEGLQQIVDGMRLERAQRVLVVRGHENDDGQVFRTTLLDQPGNHAKAIELRHLHVEEQHVHRPAGAVRALHDRKRLGAAATAPDQVDTSIGLQQIPQPPPRRLFVVDDEHPEDGAHALLLAAAAGVADTAAPARTGRSR